eukprot:scaffold106165_cov15-Tisochrysis_lutea.AAC.1
MESSCSEAKFKGLGGPEVTADCWQHVVPLLHFNGWDCAAALKRKKLTTALRMPASMSNWACRLHASASACECAG